MIQSLYYGVPTLNEDALSSKSPMILPVARMWFINAKVGSPFDPPVISDCYFSAVHGYCYV